MIDWTVRAGMAEARRHHRRPRRHGRTGTSAPEEGSWAAMVRRVLMGFRDLAEWGQEGVRQELFIHIAEVRGVSSCVGDCGRGAVIGRVIIASTLVGGMDSGSANGLHNHAWIGQRLVRFPCHRGWCDRFACSVLLEVFCSVAAGRSRARLGDGSGCYRRRQRRS